jgi:hypothetical protein
MTSSGTGGMGRGAGPGDLAHPNTLARETSTGVDGNRIAAIVSAIALAFSAYSLWETSLKQADVAVFVPPVVHFAAPYQNSNFEMVSIPITLTNEGARTGTVLSMELAVTDPRSGARKLFYAADLGPWTMEKARARGFTPFAPISLAGRTSRTENVLFYTRGDDQKPNEIIRELGSYQMTLTLEVAEAEDFGAIDRLWKAPPPTLYFERELKFYDARSFQTGTIPLYARDWRSATNAGSK